MTPLRRLRLIRSRSAALAPLRIGNPRHRMVIAWHDGRLRVALHRKHKATVIKAAGAAFVQLSQAQRERIYHSLRDGSVLLAEHEAIRFASLVDTQLVEVFGE